ncbi:MAG: pyridoxal kinase PdxY [Spirochaetia bacterium]|jgi:pyridoxine kinase|nr:pyridoxal kinase PdxY [Spirochaetia bacterium]
MNIASIQSHVVYGRVGNRSAVFPLERLGFEVWPINTVQYSCHSGYPGWTGTAFGADHLSLIVRGLQNLGVLSRCDAVLSGYMGDVDTGNAIVKAVDTIKKANPKALYCCDPVMGDLPEGLYVKKDLPAFIRSEAMSRADIVCPNVFEAELLSGHSLSSRQGVLKATDAIHGLGPRIVLVTSYRPESNGDIGFFVSDGHVRKTVVAPTLPFLKPPKGSGDLASALFLGYYLKGSDVVQALEETIGALYAVLEESLRNAADSIAIVAAQDAIASPERRFKAVDA